MHVDKRSLLAAAALTVSAFFLFQKLLLPRTIQIIVEGQQVYVQEVTGVYTFTDIIIVMISSVVMGACILYLLLPLHFRAELGSLASFKVSPNKKILDSLRQDERKIYELILNNDGVIFQSKLVEISGMPKSTVSLILDRLEAKGLVERRRRGMSNIVILKHEPK